MQHGYTRQHRGIDFIAELSPDVEGRVYIYTAKNTSAANGMTITTLNTDPLYKVNCVQPILYGVSGEDGIYYSHQTGRKKYEIKNHLGNVHLIVSDKKVGQDSLFGQSGEGIIDHYTTINTDYYDYYPFGWFIQDRNYNLNGVNLGAYRFGWQNQEKVDEIKGNGNSLNYKYRMHDSRIGRFFVVDPLTTKYPFYSPYSFSGNRVIDAVELEGLEPWIFNDQDGNVAATANGPWSLETIDHFASTNNLTSVPIDLIPKQDVVSISMPEYSNFTPGSMYNSSQSGNTINLYPSTDSGFQDGFVHGLNPINWVKDAGNALANFEMSTDRSVGFPKKSGVSHYTGLFTDSEIQQLSLAQYSSGYTLGNFAGAGVTSMVFGGGLSGAFTSSEGFLFGGVNIKAPFNIPVQRFGNISGGTQPWGLRVGTSRFVNRTFVAIKPEWNPLTKYTLGTIIKGAQTKIGIIGSQGTKYPGGLLQFNVSSNLVK